ncbi:hypothetical protein GCM10011576_17450 [Micromonospora parathelypteridis]|nr:hypothetical protein GCM10011576_17450 [Micromonospora parathelypteridis]
MPLATPATMRSVVGRRSCRYGAWGAVVDVMSPQSAPVPGLPSVTARILTLTNP